MKLRVASTIGKDTTMTVSDTIFSAPLNEQLIAQAVHVYLSNQRQGTSKTKTRSEVARTHKKWYKQKGTGGARHGARTPSIFVGGGIAHGPTGGQNWSRTMSATMRRKALCSALSAQQAAVLISDDITQLDGKTSSAQKMLDKLLPEALRIIVIADNPSQLMVRSLRNLPRVIISSSARLNTYEVVSADAIVFTKDAIKALETRLSSVEASTKTSTEAAAVEAPEKVAKTDKPKAKTTSKKPAETVKSKK